MVRDVPRGRHRVRVQVAVPPFVKAEWEWVGFRSGSSFGNLDTAIGHEIIPVIADNTLGIQSFTVHRVVGSVFLMHQGGISSAETAGCILGVEDAGADQTSDNPVVPLSTDIDEFHHKGVMWWWTGQVHTGGPAADKDVDSLEIPIDIKVKRVVHKRQRLLLQINAATTGRLRALVNIRALIRQSAGT